MQLERPLSRRLIENERELTEIRSLRDRIKVQAATDQEQKKKIQKLKTLQARMDTFRQDYFKLAHLAAKGAHKDSAKKYLLAYFYAIESLQTSLSNYFNQIDASHTVRVTEELVRELFAKQREAERQHQLQLAPE